MKLTNVNIYINNTCNLDCIYCYRTKKNKIDDDKKLENFKYICTLLKKIGVEKITLTGGEPFLDKNIYKYIRIAVANDFLVSVLTNGTIPIDEKYMQYLYDISFSIDGKQDTMMSQRGVKDFVNILDNISKCKKYNIEIIISSVITKMNINKFEKELSEFVFENHLKDILKAVKINIVETNKLDLMINEEEKKNVMKDVKKLREKFFYKIPVNTNFIDRNKFIKLVKNNLYFFPVWCDLIERNFYFDYHLKMSFEYFVSHYEKLNNKLGNEVIENSEKKYYIEPLGGILS